MDKKKRVQTCERKVKHETQELANIELERLQRVGTDTDRLHVYLCNICTKYHLGRSRIIKPHKIVLSVSVCQQKVKYNSEEQARQMLRDLLNEKITAAGLIPFLCGTCNYWHLGRKP